MRYSKRNFYFFRFLLLSLLCVLMGFFRPQRPASKPLRLEEYMSSVKLENRFTRNVESLLGASHQAQLLVGNVLVNDSLVSCYYEDTGYLVWVQLQGLTTLGQQMWRSIQLAQLYGLQPADYHHDLLASLLAHPNPEPHQLLKAEVLLTDAFFLYSFHLHHGKLDSTTNTAFWHPSAADTLVNYQQLARQLQVHHSPDLEELWQGVIPTHPAYVQLQEAMRQHLLLQENGGWPVASFEAPLDSGEAHPAISTLRRQLAIMGDLGSNSLPPQRLSDNWDSLLVDALRSFQGRHGLAPTGRLDDPTIAALQVPIEDRILQLQLNLARWHWLPRMWGDRHIWVNVPEAYLRLYAQDAIQMEMRTVVGRPARSTPFLSSKIHRLDLNPAWHIPSRMVREDIVPRLRTNANYQRHMRLQVFDRMGNPVRLDAAAWDTLRGRTFPYVIRQDPGTFNSLGRLIFRFANAWSVYLHDTPDKSGFLRTDRALSSGCIRLENPLDLANYLLADMSGWSEDVLLERLNKKDPQSGAFRTQYISLSRSCPVHIYYHTATVNKREQPCFWPDVYARDASRKAVLLQAYSPPAKR